jgi:hypothetical protein
MLWACRILLFVTSAFIAYQDFKTRLIHVWLVLLFSIINIVQYLFSNTYYQLAENTVFCISYFLFSYLVIQLFYFIKTRKLQKITDTKIGWGDILLLFSIGLCIEPVNLIFFFTVSFIVSLMVQLLFFKKDKNVPLAGMIAICYDFYLVLFTIIGYAGADQ